MNAGTLRVVSSQKISQHNAIKNLYLSTVKFIRVQTGMDLFTPSYKLVTSQHLNRNYIFSSKYIGLARAKSEALDNMYSLFSLFKQNITSCNAKRRRQARPDNGEKQQ